MALPIIEQPMYGQIKLRTTAWATPFSWVDRTSTIVGGINYAEGGRLGVPGSSQVDVGTLNVTFKNAATIPVVGDLVELSVTGATYDKVFTGYVQDVSQRVVFDTSVSLTTPVTLTTINCVDWVGYISQFQAVGVGGSHPTTGVDETDSYYAWDYRIAALNKIVDASYATKMIYATPGDGVGTLPLGDTDVVGTLAAHLDLLTVTTGMAWAGNHTIPTNKTTGRTSLVEVFDLSGATSSGLTFTDVAGTSGQLHYTEIDFENSTQNVANVIVANNRVRFNVTAAETTKIGGFNQENFVIVNNTPVIGVGLDITQSASDATSITTYGNRQTEIYTNVAMPATYSRGFNLVTNPSCEYSDDGWSSGAAKSGRRRPSEESTPFTAFNGEWAYRYRFNAAATTPTITFSGSEADGIPVTPWTYYFSARVLRGSPSRADGRARAQIIWLDESGSTISTTSGSYVALTTGNTWYQVTATATAPVGAERVLVRVEYSRSGGGQWTAGDKVWADALMFSGGVVSGSAYDYFDGDTEWNSTYGYIWTGGVGASVSYRINNGVDDVAVETLARYSTTSNRVGRIRWNAQEDIDRVGELTVGATISVRFNGSTSTYRIVGIDGNVDPERYMIDYYLAKV